MQRLVIFLVDSACAVETVLFYRVRGGVKFCAQRAKAYGQYADAVWMETAIRSRNFYDVLPRDMFGAFSTGGDRPRGSS